MANICPTSLHICRIRLTRLTSTGAVAAAPNNHVVSANPMQMTMEPEIQEGTSSILIGGCDCPIVTYRGKDKLLRWNLTLQMGTLEPAMVEILTGGALLSNGSAEPIGGNWPLQLTCTSTAQPDVAIEAWSENYIGDRPNATYPYIRWVFPSSSWQWDTATLENDFQTPQFKGFTRTNTLWTNPYVDLPTGVTSSGGAIGSGTWFFDSTIPTPVCGYSTFST